MRIAQSLIRLTRDRMQFVFVIPFVLCHSVNAAQVSYWAAEGNPHDSVGPNSGTTIGSVTYSVGQFGQAFALAKTGYIDIPAPVTGGLASSTGFTIAAWVYRNGVGSGWGTASVANLRTTVNNSGFSLEEVYQQPYSMAFHVNTGGVKDSFVSILATGWDFGKFHHIAATFDAATHRMVLYRNGEVVASRDDVPNAGMITNSASAFQIGRNIPNGSQWNGLIDEVRFYDCALSQLEIKQIMNSIVMQTPEIKQNSSVVIRWASLTNRLYTLHHSTNLLSGFSILEGNIPATPPINSYTDAVNNVMMKFWKVTTEE